MLRTEVAFHTPEKLCPLPQNYAGEKGPSDISSPTSCSKQVQALSGGFGCLLDGSCTAFLSNVFPVFDHPHCENVFS